VSTMPAYRSPWSLESGLRPTVSLTMKASEGTNMTLKKIAICAAALVFASLSGGLAQAGSKGTPNGGVSLSLESGSAWRSSKERVSKRV
jgi:hypothetical protein